VTTPSLAVSFSPDPATAQQGVVISVTGPVQEDVAEVEGTTGAYQMIPRGQIVVTGPGYIEGLPSLVDGVIEPNVPTLYAASGVVRAISPVFGMLNRAGLTSQVNHVVVADAAGGTFVLVLTRAEFVDELRGDAQVLVGQTDDIDYQATATAVQSACDDAWGAGNVVVTGGPAGSADLIFTFGGDLAGKALDLTANVAKLTGEGHAVTSTATTPGGDQVVDMVAGGPYNFGPLFLDSGTYSIDVLAAEDDDTGGISAGDSLLDSPVALVVSYGYGDD
jgi:hypothetical protein